ncbi:CoA transferase [Streptomyces sp. NBC_01005]|uniref:CaiB/BaiF CoA transferase family protein n=1 Tax=unclassified Streptomyces TaxID=2593676 RepID=UPI002E2F9BED|nr:CoA transferase [Streptomyces sp. NBC_01362]WSW06847.1 CoA transferase [Streptomyces sp. NBC_01005]WTB55299.1 CoA transferase [Streptomyces sp. NBC_00826]WTC96353.1 CoA transferase [Streptomyces sp. NBC_01650]WTH91818.1 CoA transferase [Streptomyces sp. NBC_00825]WTI00546.1 CoA transferase [Streptomyces sp. NBC_00822]
MAKLPLEGIRVLDLSTVLAAPVTATFLGDFGAEVVKVEEPGRGDFTRGTPTGARSPYWAQEARNKKSVTLDLRTERGRSLVRDLVPHFDVVITNYRPPTLVKWGLDPDSLRALAPDAILVYVTGYGLTGPYRDRGSFDRIASAFAGLTHVTGDPDRPPVRSGYSTIDYMAAYLGAFSVVTALYHRDTAGGGGQVVDLALYEAGFRASEDALASYATTGQVRERLGNRNPKIVPASDFTTSDGRRLSLHAGTDPLFRRLAALMGTPEIADAPEYATRAARAENAESLYAAIADWVAAYTAVDLAKRLNEAGIPASPLMTIADIAADPHYRERGTLVTVQDPEFGELPMPAPVPRMSETPGSIRTTGPALGEHNAEVYQGLLGIDAEQLAALRGDGVI